MKVKWRLVDKGYHNNKEVQLIHKAKVVFSQDGVVVLQKDKCVRVRVRVGVGVGA